MDHAKLWNVHGALKTIIFNQRSIYLFLVWISNCLFFARLEQIINAFTISWAYKKLYCFPPFSCILQVLQKIIQDQATCMVVIHNWPTVKHGTLCWHLSSSFLQSSFTPKGIYWNYQNGLSYSTVNTARSMLSSVLQLNINSSLPVGQLPIVKRLI